MSRCAITSAAFLMNEAAGYYLPSIIWMWQQIVGGGGGDAVAETKLNSSKQLISCDSCSLYVVVKHGYVTQQVAMVKKP